MNSQITQWALKFGIPYGALTELEIMFGQLPSPGLIRIDHLQNESYVQSLVRLEAARKGMKLWRNNVGVLRNEQTGQPVRYGLANDSPALNKAIKSGDLIGWRPIVITPLHIGHKIAQFVSRECKAPNWTYTGTDREIAQLKWAEVLNADGGDACFVNNEGTL